MELVHAMIQLTKCQFLATITHSLFTHPLTVYSPTHCIFTHSLYSHTSTLYSPSLSVFTKSLYTHILSLYSPTHSIFTYLLYIRSTKFIVGVKTKISQKFKQSIYSYNIYCAPILVNMCTLNIYGMHTWDNRSRVN